MTNAIVEKKLIRFDVVATSPICVSNGEASYSDSDILRDYDGNPFIPGSSIAGALRDSLCEEDQKLLFGCIKMNDEEKVDRMSSLYISDLTFSDHIKIGIREGVSLTDKKTAQTASKFDMEILETGAEGCFYIELILRKNDLEKKDQMISGLKKAIGALAGHDIRFGSKKTRGYGEIDLTSIKEIVYTKDNILDYANGYAKSSWDKVADEKENWLGNTSAFILIEVPLCLKGCISIRQYAAKKNLPDYVHITSNGKPVITGTALAGALRHRIKDILIQELKVKDAEKYVSYLFGKVPKKSGAKEKETEPAQKSLVVFSEVAIEGAKPLTVTRNAISRFECATKEHALYKEQSYQGGNTILQIRVEKNENKDALVGLLLLGLYDLQKGYLNLGGQGSVGKGVFEANGSIKIDGADVKEGDDKPYLSAFVKWVEEQHGID